MPLKLMSACTYLVEVGAQKNWRNEDYHANKFIKALKGEPIRGHASLPIAGGDVPLDESNREEAFHWFGTWAAAQLKERYGRLQFVLIPVPSSKMLMGTSVLGPPFKMAQSLQTTLKMSWQLDAEVWDGLRWRNALPAAHGSRGRRDPRVYYEALSMDSSRPLTEGPVVLIDDVVTSGAHMRAAAAKLRAGGLEPFQAICAGRAVNTKAPNVFDVPDEDLEDFEPDTLF